MSPFFRYKLVGIAIVWALLNSCIPVEPNYAPVFTNNNSNPPAPTKPVNTVKNEPQSYQVKKGDTLYAISLIYDVDYQQLAQWNQISPPYKIEVGQKIRLSDPNPGRPAQADEKATTQVADVKPQLMAPPQANKSSPARNSPILPAVINVKPALADKTPDKLPATSQDSNEKPGNSPQKKSIISIDNESMLKLNFQWPIKGKILKPFAHADNKGIDIAGEKGQAVKAAEAGKVVYSGQGLFGYGNLLIIKHNDLYLSAYANNSELLVEEGHTVKKGEVVAKVGQAESSRASLHFEIRKNGKPVNPMIFLPGK